jgi:hypothetical protein
MKSLNRNKGNLRGGLRLRAAGGDAKSRFMERAEAIRTLRERTHQIAGLVTGLHPLVPALQNPAAQGEILKALFGLTKEVEVIKKHLIKLEKGDGSALV